MARLLITLNPAATPIVVAGEADTVETFVLAGAPLVQVVKLPSAPVATVLDRGNRQRTLEIAIKCAPKANPFEALRWALALELALGGAATALRIDYGAPGVGIRIEAADTSLQVRASHQGVTPLLSITVTLGIYTVVNLPLTG